MTAAPNLDEPFRASLRAQALTPLWEHLRSAIPVGRPAARTQARCWRYDDIRPLLLEAGRTVPVGQAERRVLALADPGRAQSALQATGTLYAGIQLLLPGEKAPTHRHTPSAARIVIEGQGGFTVVDGRRCEMARGDLVLTPALEWHDHGHDGSGPVTWLDVLDLPVHAATETACAEHGGGDKNREDPSAVLTSELRAMGLQPARRNLKRRTYPRIHYPWRQTRTALFALLHSLGPAAAEVRYVNPETGESCLPLIGFTAMLLMPGAARILLQRSSAALFHVVEGRGRACIDDAELDWGPGDTFSAPSFARIMLDADAKGEPALLIRADDEPLQTRLGVFTEQSAA
jgi:gentisate 1,2-dioxygenase